MTDVVRRIGTAWHWLSDKLPFDAHTELRYAPTHCPRVLAIGIYLAKRPNTMEHIVGELGRSEHCAVTQRWVALGSTSSPRAVAAVTVATEVERVPKFVLLNRLLAGSDWRDFDYVLVCDDDIRLPHRFVDRFIGWQQHCGFALAQPARTWNSFVDHTFVRRYPLSSARETRFVEIGPLFSVSRELAPALLPFDETSPMGWGYDLVWPAVVAKRGLKLGIVDDAAVDHSLRARGAAYDTAATLEQMKSYLANNEHLRAKDCFVNLQQFR